MGALYKGFIATAVISAVLIYGVTYWQFPADQFGTDGLSYFLCAVVGLAVTGLIVWVTEFYTGTNYRPVQSVARVPRKPATRPT